MTDIRLRPVLDEDGLLRVGAAWVAIPPSQLLVVQLLLDHFGSVVRLDAIVAALREVGHSGHLASVRSLLTRVRTRVASVGLELVTVRQRGVLLRFGD